MLDLGGAAQRPKLIAMVKSNLMSADVNAGQEYNAEEAKVQMHGDIGQGNRLTDAKKAA